MKTFDIAAKELRTLFYSPVAWFVLLAFYVHTTLVFLGKLSIWVDYDGTWVTLWALGPDLGFYGIRSGITQFLHFYIPLLTMGLFSTEFAEGGIKLVLSSPVRTRHLVLGKFLSMMLVGLALTASIVLLTIVSVIFLIDNMDIAFVLYGVALFYLYICFFAAIGLFVSSLTASPLVAAVGTFGVLFILQSFSGNIVSDGMPQFLQYLLGVWLPPGNHTRDGWMGMVNVADVLYFLIMIALFLGLTWLRLQSLRASRPVWINAMQYAGAVCVALGFGLLAYRHAFYYVDVTAPKWWTPSAAQTQALAALPEPLIVTRYFNVLENPKVTQPLTLDYRARALKATVRSSLDIRYVPYYGPTRNLHPEFRGDADARIGDIRATALATGAQLQDFSTDGMDVEKLAQRARATYAWLRDQPLLTVAQVRAMTDTADRPDYTDFYVFQSGRKKVLLYNSIFTAGNQEQILVAALQSLAAAPLKIAFVAGHGERNPFGAAEEDYGRIVLPGVEAVGATGRIHEGRFTESLSNQGFDVANLNLNEEVPADIAVLVIADPRQRFSAAELQALRRYYERGGNLLILGEPGRAGIANDIAAIVGVQLIDSPPQAPNNSQEEYGAIVSASVRHTPATANALLDQGQRLFFTGRQFSLSKKYRGGRTPIDLEYYYRDNNYDLVDEGVGYEINIPSAAALQGQKDIPGMAYSLLQQSGQTVILALARPSVGAGGRQQRIVVAGDADFMSNAAESIGPLSALRAPGKRGRNKVFTVALFKWLSNDRVPVDLKKTWHRETYTGIYAPAYRVITPEEHLVDAKRRFRFINSIAFGEGLALAALGAFVVVRRRRN